MSDQALEAREYKAGELIFKQGDEGDDAFIVESGQIEIASGKSNAELVIATIDKGGLFGEMALIDDSPRMASARATRKTTCIVIPKKVFTRLMKSANPVLQVVLNTVMDRLRDQVSGSAKSAVG